MARKRSVDASFAFAFSFTLAADGLLYTGISASALIQIKQGFDGSI